MIKLGSYLAITDTIASGNLINSHYLKVTGKFSERAEDVQEEELSFFRVGNNGEIQYL